MKNKNLRKVMLVLKAVITFAFTAIIIYNIFKGELLWAILFTQQYMFFVYLDDKRESLCDEMLDMEFKHLMIQSQVKTMNAVKDLLEKDAEKAKEILEQAQQKRRGRKPKSE